MAEIFGKKTQFASQPNCYNWIKKDVFSNLLHKVHMEILSKVCSLVWANTLEISNTALPATNSFCNIRILMQDALITKELTKH